ncbi:MAG: DUF5104 domain-containing protein [Clostridia bacterium]|nr:DUF5104 domain-containing protein [Clostridia bacterium]
MRKLLFLLSILISAIVLSSCSGGEGNLSLDKDFSVAKEKNEIILEALESQSNELLTMQFSTEYVNNTSGFSATVEELFDYFNGEVLSYNDWGGPLVETTKENDQVFQTMEATLDVQTTECEYRLAIKYVTKDTSNPKNVGVHSLYVIKANDDICLEYAYWGDGKFTPGINIGIPNIE